MAEPMSAAPARIRNAATIGLVALGIGLIAQFLFVDAAFGINVPIGTAALLAAGWVVRDRSKAGPRILDAWLAPAALIFASFVALRGDVTLIDLDMLAALALTGWALASFGGLAVAGRPAAAIASLAGRMAVSTLAAGGRALAGLGGLLPRPGTRPRAGFARPVLRGLLIVAPLALLFVVLFASADAVFARIAGDLLDWHLDLGTIPIRLAFALVVGWLAAGVLTFVAIGRDEGVPPGAMEAWEGRPRLGSAEAVTGLVVLDLLFAAFVALQFTYLFGGQDTLAASGLTYAEYARRGFFELLAVAFLVSGLVFAMEAFVRVRTRAYLVGAVGLVVLTIVVLASAFLRLRLYQEAYGWTELRFYVLAAIAWLAIGAAMAVGTLLADRTRWLAHGLAVVAIGIGLAINLIGPVRFIAEQNIERALHPELVAAGGETGLDIAYLSSLGDDALQVLAAHPCMSHAYSALKARAEQLARDEAARAWQAWNLSRELVRHTTPPAEFCLL